jgi:hypothetical protein
MKKTSLIGGKVALQKDPFLIFERESGDLVTFASASNDLIDLSGKPGPTSLYLSGATTGKDTVTGFGREDILIVDQAIFDRNGDGIVTFGRNGLLDLDGPSVANNSVRFTDGPDAKAGLRLIGVDDKGAHVYADARVRPDGAVEGKLGDDVLAGDAGDAASQTFFIDTALDVNWGNDTLTFFGANDDLVTTTAIFDGNKDGKITFGKDGLLDLNGNGALDASHAGPQGDASPFGKVAIKGVDGASVNALYLTETRAEDGTTYYVYKLAPIAVESLI